MKQITTKSSVASASQKLAEFAALMLGDVIRDLAMEENKAGRVARKVMRAERDGQSESVKHLVEPLGLAILKAMPKVRKKDLKTGRWKLTLDLPAEWRE